MAGEADLANGDSGSRGLGFDAIHCIVAEASSIARVRHDALRGTLQGGRATSWKRPPQFRIPLPLKFGCENVKRQRADKQKLVV